MSRRWSGIAVLVLLTGVVAGCTSRGNEMETVYNGCIDSFSESAPEQANVDLGSAEDYLSYDDNKITVTTPTDKDASAASVGANTAALCVMQGLKAPADATTQAATGKEPGKASWGDYNATWNTDGPDKVGLVVTGD